MSDFMRDNCSSCCSSTTRASAVVDSTGALLASDSLSFGSADIAETVAAAARTGAGTLASLPVDRKATLGPDIAIECGAGANNFVSSPA